MATEQSKENPMSNVEHSCRVFRQFIDVLQRLKLMPLWWKNDERIEYVKRHIDIQKR